MFRRVISVFSKIHQQIISICLYSNISGSNIDANTTNMEMVYDATKVDFNLVKSSAFLNPSLLKLFQNESCK